MTTNNLFAVGEKSWQKITCDSVTCNDMECITHIVDDLSVQTISVDAPATEITINDTVIMLQDLEVQGNIIGNITDEDINVNTIQTANTGRVNIISETIFEQNIKIADEALEQLVPAQVMLNLKSVGSQGIWVESDTNGVGLQDPYLFLSTCQNTMGSQIRTNDDDGPMFTELELYAGVTANATGGGFDFYTAQMVDNGDALPTWITEDRLFRIGDVSNISDRNLNMSSNNLTFVNDVITTQVTTNQIISDFDIATKIEIIDGAAFDDIISLDSPRLMISGYMDIPGIGTPGDTGLSITGGRLWNDGLAPPNINWITTAGTVDLTDPYGQDLTTTGSPTFADITADGYFFSSYVDQCAVYTKSALAVLAATDTTLIGWTASQTTTKVDFDIVTGIFTPGDGVYSIIYNGTITTVAAATEIGFRLVDDLAATTYISVVSTSDLFDAETGFEGAQYENMTAVFEDPRTYTFHIKLDAAETMDFKLQFARLM